MAYIHFDSHRAPCGFLIVATGADPADDSRTTLVQTDWDYPGIAGRLGWIPCPCGATDGTIDCEHRKAVGMIAEAFDRLHDHDGEDSPELDDCLPPRS